MMSASPFAIRGVIEGFYGTPWTHEQRLSLITFLAAHGMNTFVYAPKDDPLVREDWRIAYDGADLSRMQELVSACAAHDIEFVYCLSPGLSVEYSSAPDRATLSEKLRSVGAIGVASFGLLLDDIPDELQYPSDRDAFVDLVDAHTVLVGDVFDNLTKGDHLFVCPAQYWGRGNEDYITRLGLGIDPRIDLFWTGRAICSATLDRADAELFADSTGRQPVYWDNYPVNDINMTHELHIGPYQGRDRDLHLAARGVITNGMELFESSRIAFATIADYLHDPAGYDAEASWLAAIREVAGPDAEAFDLFADNVRSSCLSADDAPMLTRAIESFGFNSQYGSREQAADGLAELASRMLSAADHLLGGDVVNAALIAEARPWIEAFRLGAEAVGCIAELYAAGRLASDGPTELNPYLGRLRDSRRRVFGDLLDMTLSDLTIRRPSHQNDRRSKEAAS